MDELRSFEQELVIGLDRLAGPALPVDAAAVARAAVRGEPGPVAGGITLRWRPRAAHWGNALRTRSIWLPAAALGLLLMTFGTMFVTFGPVVDERPAAVPVPTPDTRPTDAAIVWDNGRVRITASDFRLVIDGQILGRAMEDIEVGPDLSKRRWHEAAMAREGTWITVDWTEQGNPMSLFIEFATDDGIWWVDQVRHNGGQGEDGYVDYPPGLLETPIGESFVGDVRIDGGIGESRDADPISGDERIPVELRELRADPVRGTIEIDDAEILVRELGPDPNAPETTRSNPWDPVSDAWDRLIGDISQAIFGRS